jgi:hypothetical protein
MTARRQVIYNTVLEDTYVRVDPSTGGASHGDTVILTESNSNNSKITTKITKD